MKSYHKKIVIGGLLTAIVAAVICVTIISMEDREETTIEQIKEYMDSTPGVGQGYIDAEVLEKHDEHIVVECTKGYLQEVSVGDKLRVSLKTLSGEPVPTVQAGDRVRVLYIGELSRDDDGVIAPQDTISLFLIDEDGDIVS